MACGIRCRNASPRRPPDAKARSTFESKFLKSAIDFNDKLVFDSNQTLGANRLQEDHSSRTFRRFSLPRFSEIGTRTKMKKGASDTRRVAPIAEAHSVVRSSDKRAVM